MVDLSNNVAPIGKSSFRRGGLDTASVVGDSIYSEFCAFRHVGMYGFENASVHLDGVLPQVSV